MTPQPPTSDPTTQAIRAFLASYDASDASDREVAYRLRERALHAEWIDIGGGSA